jgi:hypothetical protein
MDAVLDQLADNINSEELVPGSGVLVRTERNTLRAVVVRRNAVLAGTNSPAAQEDDLRRTEASIRSSTDLLAPFDKRLADSRERVRGEIELVRTIRGGLDDWASAHRRISAAALEQKPLQVDDLVQTALLIQDLIGKTRASKKE